MTSIIDKEQSKESLLGLSCALLVVLTLFISQWFVILCAPVTFYYGAILRGKNKIKTFKKVTQLKTTIK